MPKFEVHDSETGLKLLVEGEGPPTEEEAAKLVNDELSFLRSNLYHAPGGRYLLDVGPLSGKRKKADAMAPIVTGLERYTQELAAARRAGARAKQAVEVGEHWPSLDTEKSLFSKFYEEEIAQMAKRFKETPKPSDETLGQLEPGTLLISAHGGTGKPGQFTSEGGQPFTMHNVAQVLGTRSNEVRRVINTACYGAQCPPEEMAGAFPNLEEIKQADPTKLNYETLGHMAGGAYFATNTVPGLWRRFEPGRQSELGPSYWLEEPIWADPLAAESKWVPTHYGFHQQPAP